MKPENGQYALVLKREIFANKKYGCTAVLKNVFGRFRNQAFHEF